MTSVSDFYCTECGRKGLPVVRTSRHRESGHLKKLFCFNCKKEVNHVEVRTGGTYTKTDFDLEFKNHNFKNGERILTINQLKAKVRENE